MEKSTSCIRLPLLFVILMACAFPKTFGAQPSAQSSVNKMVAVLKKHPSLDIVFTVWNDGNSSTGSMCVAGRNFHLSTPEMKIWYDGKTQWSYAPSAGEVNITMPTIDELAQSNPLSVLSGLNNNFSFRRLKAPSGQEKIELIPKKPTHDFASAILTLDSATSLPKEITVKDSRGRATSVVISSVKGGKAKPTGVFRFDPKRYPGVEVIDLR